MATFQYHADIFARYPNLVGGVIEGGRWTLRLEFAETRDREAVWYMDHAEIGRFGYYTMPFKLSATPAQPQLPPPCMGEHTEWVCTNILNMPIEEFIALLNDDVFV